MPFPLHFAGYSDLGIKRKINEDCWWAGEIAPANWLFIVADGIGGEKAGEVASQMAIESLRTELLKATAPDAACLLAAIRQTDQAIIAAGHANTAHAGMGCTLTVAWISEKISIWGQVGDSKLFRLRQGTLTPLTPEHSHVGRLRRAGTLTAEEAKRHPLRSVIDQSLGNAAAPLAPEAEHFEFKTGDALVLCSDGLTDGLEEPEIVTELLAAKSNTVAVKVERLVKRSVKKSGRDNTTAILVQAYPEHISAWRRLIG